MTKSSQHVVRQKYSGADVCCRLLHCLQRLTMQQEGGLQLSGVARHQLASSSVTPQQGLQQGRTTVMCMAQRQDYRTYRHKAATLLQGFPLRLCGTCLLAACSVDLSKAAAGNLEAAQIQPCRTAQCLWRVSG